MIDTNEGVEMTRAATCPGVIALVTSTATSLVMPTGTGPSGSLIELVHRIRVGDVPTAIHDEYLPRHVCCEIADGEQQGTGDIGRFRQSARRNELCDPCSLLGAQHFEHARRQRAAGRD